MKRLEVEILKSLSRDMTPQQVVAAVVSATSSVLIRNMFCQLFDVDCFADLKKIDEAEGRRRLEANLHRLVSRPEDN